MVNEFLRTVKHSKSSVDVRPSQPYWTPPAIGKFKINVDVALSENLSVEAMVIRDHKELLLELATDVLEALSPIVAEVKALV